MNILFLNQQPFSYLGGVEFHILNLARQLVKRSHSVTLVCRESGLPVKHEGVRVVQVPGLLDLCRFLRDEAGGFDVCHAHMSRKAFSAVGLIYARRLGYKTIFTPHCFYPSSSFAHRLLKPMYDATLGKWAFESCDAVINLTPYDRQDALLRGMDPSKSVTIPNSICMEKLQSYTVTDFKKKYDLHHPFLLHVGRFQRHKCIDFLVDQMQSLADQYLLLIGQDDGDMGRVKEHIAAAKLGDRVRIFQRMSFDDLCSAYAQASALVMASSNEGLPTVILEAMALSVPVVAPRVGGIPWVIEDGRTGFLYNWLDSAGFVQAVREALQRREEIAAAALLEVREGFSWEANALRTEALYEQIQSTGLHTVALSEWSKSRWAGERDSGFSPAVGPTISTAPGHPDGIHVD